MYYMLYGSSLSTTELPYKIRSFKKTTRLVERQVNRILADCVNLRIPEADVEQLFCRIMSPQPRSDLSSLKSRDYSKCKGNVYPHPRFDMVIALLMIGLNH